MAEASEGVDGKSNKIAGFRWMYTSALGQIEYSSPLVHPESSMPILTFYPHSLCFQTCYTGRSSSSLPMTTFQSLLIPV